MADSEAQIDRISTCLYNETLANNVANTFVMHSKGRSLPGNPTSDSHSILKLAAERLADGKKSSNTSKYDYIKIKVWLGKDLEHYYILSRFLISRILTVTKVPQDKVRTSLLLCIYYVLLAVHTMSMFIYICPFTQNTGHQNRPGSKKIPCRF